MSSDLNGCGPLPDCPIDGKPCEGQGTIVQCRRCRDVCAHESNVVLEPGDREAGTQWLWCPDCGAVRLMGYVPPGADLRLYTWRLPRRQQVNAKQEA